MIKKQFAITQSSTKIHKTKCLQCCKNKRIYLGKTNWYLCVLKIKLVEFDINRTGKAVPMRERERERERRVIAREQSAVSQPEKAVGAGRAGRTGLRGGRRRHERTQWTGRVAPWWASRTPHILSGKIYGPRTRKPGALLEISRRPIADRTAITAPLFTANRPLTCSPAQDGGGGGLRAAGGPR